LPVQPQIVRFARNVFLSTAAATVCAAVFSWAAARADLPAVTDAVGGIDGESIAVTGPMTVDMVHGQAKTVLRSGSDVRVKSGTARIDLVEGGSISICGPAHFSVLKSGGSLTVALDSGIINVHVEREPAVTVYTAQVQAQPVAIGEGPKDLLVGFDATGVMCVRANRGAVRLEQQLTGQSVMVPQAGDVVLLNGQIDSLKTTPGHCVCEPLLVRTAPATETEVSRLATPEEIKKRSFDAKPKLPDAKEDRTPAKDEPIYQVIMPPLVYDAKTKVEPQFDPKMILLIRKVRVRPTLIFTGRVEGVAIAAALPPASPAPATHAATPAKPAAPANDSLVDRVRNFVRKLWSRS
jgi:hypothetical protein